MPICFAAGAAALLASSLVPSPISAAAVRLSSRTYLLVYQEDPVLGSTRRFFPLYESLAGEVERQGGGPLSFSFHGWGRADLGEKTGSDRTSGDLASAYLQYLHPRGDGQARLGRFFLAEGTAAEVVDGVFLKGTAAGGFGAALFGGHPVEDVSSGVRGGSSLYGGRLFSRFDLFPSFLGELGLGYLAEKGPFRGKDRQEVGADLWLRVGGAAEVSGRSIYNRATEGMALQRYFLRLQPAESLDISLGSEDYHNRDLMQKALNPAFADSLVDPADEVRILSAGCDFRAGKALTLEASLKRFRHRASDPGNASRGELGLRYRFNRERDTAGVWAAAVTADRGENAYRELRAFSTLSLERWTFSLDALGRAYDQAPGGSSSAWQVVGSAGTHLLPSLNLSGDLRWAKSPAHKKDVAVLIRAVYEFPGPTEATP